MKRFGEKLHMLRQQRGLTLRQLADLVGVHNTHLSKIELGKKRPSSDLILQIAGIFNVTTDQLMRDDFEVDYKTSDK